MHYAVVLTLILSQLSYYFIIIIGDLALWLMGHFLIKLLPLLRYVQHLLLDVLFAYGL